MKRHFRRVSRAIAVAFAAALMAGCAADPVSDSLQPRVDDSGRKQDRVTTLIRVAAATAVGGDHGTAAGLYRRAHALERKNVAALVGLGKELSVLGAYDQAAESFRNALEIEAGNVDAMHGLGNALIALDRPTAAITQFEAAMQIRDEARTYNGMGVAHDKLGDHEAARAFYRTGLTHEPGNLNMRNNLALSLALVGKYDEAIAIMRRVAADPRAGSRQRLNLALVYGLSGDSESAASVARIDLDERSVRKNLAYYRTLRAMNDSRAAINAIGTHGVLDIGARSR